MIAVFLSPVYLLVCAYVLQWTLRWLAACHPFLGCLPFQLIFSLVYLCTATTLLSSFLIKKPASVHHVLKQISNIWLGIFFYSVLGIGIADLAHFLLESTPLASYPLYRAKWMFPATGSATALFILSISLWGCIRARKPQTTTYHISIDKNGGKHRTLNIVLIADLHLGYNLGVHHLRRIVSHINDLHPDLVVIAGDIFDNDFSAIRHPKKCAGILKSIKSTYGTYCCYGNHDVDEAILAGFTFRSEKPNGDKRFEKFFRDAKITLLNDRRTLINDSFYLIGRRDAYRCEKLDTENGRMAPDELTRALDISKPVILLDHQPTDLQKLSDAGVDLDLSGHTHDGQVFPLNLLLPFFWENSYGICRKGDMYSIVTSGIGVWGPAMRLGTKGEICHIQVHFT